MEDNQGEKMIPEEEAVAEALVYLIKRVAIVELSLGYELDIDFTSVKTWEQIKKLDAELDAMHSPNSSQHVLESIEQESVSINELEAQQITRGQELPTHAVNAMMQASGLNINQAKTAIYYAVATHILDTLDEMPILVFYGKAGTGKSEAIKQLQKLVYNPVVESGRASESVMRDKMKRNEKGYSTIFIEEADTVSEQLINDRYSKQAAKRTVNRAANNNQWDKDDVDIFGATVLHKRVPFADVAVRSRSITIRTTHKPGNYSITGIGNDETKAVADSIRMNMPDIETSDRISNTWRPLLLVTKAVKDNLWLEYAEQQIKLENQSLKAGHGYEPEEALIYTLKALCDLTPQGQSLPVKISTIRDHMIAEFGVSLHNYPIEQMAIDLGFKVTKPHGYPTVQPDDTLLQQLLDQLRT